MKLLRLLRLLLLSFVSGLDVKRAAKKHVSRDDTGRLQSEYPFYHSSEELAAEAKRLVAKCKVSAKLKTMKKDYVSIDEIRLSTSKTSKPRNRVSLLFGEHSRELIGPETGLQLLKMLCGEKEEQLVEKALKDSEFQLILNANPVSRAKVEAGDYCLRENPNGVDLNRNWDEKWSLGSASSSDMMQFHGSRPFSEPETQLVRDLITDFRPTTFLSVHSGTLGMYMPWAYDSRHLAERNRGPMLSVLEDLDSSHCQCPFGAAGKEVGYDCPGTSFDWVYDHLKAPFSFAWEIYADPLEGESLRRRWEEKVAQTQIQEHVSVALVELYTGMHSDFMRMESSALASDECFSTFNPGTEEAYNASVTNWARSYLNLAIKTAPHV